MSWVSNIIMQVYENCVYVIIRKWHHSKFETDPVKSRSREIGGLNFHIALKFDRHIGSNAAEVPVKFQSDRAILNTNLTASRLHEILR